MDANPTNDVTPVETPFARPVRANRLSRLPLTRFPRIGKRFRRAPGSRRAKIDSGFCELVFGSAVIGQASVGLAFWSLFELTVRTELTSKHARSFVIPLPNSSRAR